MKWMAGLLLVLSVTGCGSAELVPADFTVPVGFETDRFRVRPITVADAEMDYEAVMEGIELIHSALLDDRWPSEEFTLEQNKRDLAEKERRFQQTKNFTYTVVSPDEKRVLGCVYVFPGIGGPVAVRMGCIPGPRSSSAARGVALDGRC